MVDNQQEIGRRQTFLEQYSTDQLAHLARSELEEVWDHYDEDRNGVLEGSELDHLATAAVIRVEARMRDMVRSLIEEEQMVTPESPKYTPEQLEIELNTTLNSVFNKSTIEEARRDLVKSLGGEDDCTQVTKQQFLEHWEAFAVHFQEADAVVKTCTLL